ncbi:MAG: hypothetical protein L6244_06680, partial [Candidatus Methanoperedenaceae archaeon]|nr:hypothetical protein [Candidatus Methanoperedenaceae archaeon]
IQPQESTKTVIFFLVPVKFLKSRKRPEIRFLKLLLGFDKLPDNFFIALEVQLLFYFKALSSFRSSSCT